MEHFDRIKYNSVIVTVQRTIQTLSAVPRYSESWPMVYGVKYNTKPPLLI